MDQIFAGYSATHLLVVLVGIALLLAGRKLYWLALGGIGFFLGLWLAEQILDLRSSGLELGLGFLIGVLGAFLATAAQRLAIALGGLFIGGFLAYWAAAWAVATLHWQNGPWIWFAVALGSIFGLLVAALLFEASLVALTSLIGALLIAQTSHIGQPHESWLFLILLAVGLIAQSGGSRRRRRRRAEA